MRSSANFPALKAPLIYLDSAATAQKPQSVIDAMSNFYANDYGTVHRAIYRRAATATHLYNQVREKVCAFLNAKKTEEIIFTHGTTDAINLLARSFGSTLQPGDEILVPEIEHHANIVPWQMICQECKAVLRPIPVMDSGDLDLDAFRAMLSPKTKLVALAHISHSVGVEHPIAEIIALAHAHGAKVLIDAAQSVAHRPLDVQALDADFLVFSGHKLYGPTGIGILYGKEDILSVLPPYQRGGDMIEEVTFAKTTYNTLPLRFEAGTPPIAEVIGLGTAIDFLLNIGFTAIMAHEQTLMNRLETIEHVRIIGHPHKRGSLLSFTSAKMHSLDIATLLDLKGIAVRSGHLCSQPTMQRFGVTSVVRASLGLYNTLEEIDIFLQQINRILR